MTSPIAVFTVLPSSSLIGVVSVFGSSFAVQPGTGWVSTTAIGFVVRSKKSWIFVVDAVSLSVGTRNVTTVKPPCGADDGLMVTWANAAPARPKAPNGRAENERAGSPYP